MKIEQVCDSVGVQPSLSCLCACQRNRSNVPAQNACDYFRHVISIPMLDHLISELESRFGTHKQTALQGLYHIPAVLVTKCFEEIAPKVRQFGGEMYSIQSVTFQVRFIVGILKWKQQ